MSADILALLAKMTAILGVAGMLAIALRRSSAAWRHFVWSAAMSCVLVLLVVQFLMPPIVMRVGRDSSLRVFARQDDGSAIEHVTRSPLARSSTADVADAPRTSTLRVSRDGSQPTQAASDHSAAVTVVDPPVRSANGIGMPRELSAGVQKFEQHAGASTASFMDQPRNMLLWIWASGTLLLLVRLGRSHHHVRRLTRSARVLENAALNAEVAAVCAQLSESRTVTLLTHPDVHAPYTAGCRPPVIMLSDSVMQWSQQRRRAVLTHEVAHIVRGDSVSQTIASVVCALFWFHPLVWVGARAIRGESERAADDLVIRAGMLPVEYADHLMAIVTQAAYMRTVPTAAIGMANTSQLEARLRAMLSAQQSRRVISRSSRHAVGGLSLLAVLPLAAAQLRLQPLTVASHTPNAKPAQEKAAFGANGIVKPMPTDTIIEKSIAVTSNDVLTIFADLPGSVIFHAGTNDNVTVRASVPATLSAASVSLDRVKDGPRMAIAGAFARKSTSARVNYEVWMPSTMPLFFAPMNGPVSANVELFGVRGVKNIQHLQIKGRMEARCVSAAVAHISADMRAAFTCGVPTAAPSLFKALEVTVNDQRVPNRVRATVLGMNVKSPFVENSWTPFGLNEFDADSIVVSGSKDSSTVIYNLSPRTKSSIGAGVSKR